MELLVTLGAEAADRASEPRHNHRIHIDLDIASVEDIAKYVDAEVDAITIIVSTWAALRRAVIPLRLIGPTKDLKFRVLNEVTPSSFLPGVWPGIKGRLLEMTSRAQADNGTVVRVRLSRAVPAHLLIGFMVQNSPSVLTPPLRVALTHRVVEPFAIGSANVRYTGVDDVVTAGGVSVPVSEVVLTPADERGSRSPVTVVDDDSRPRVAVVTDPARSTSAGLAIVSCPPIDTAVVNPMAFDNQQLSRVGHVLVERDGVGVVADAEHRTIVRLEPGAPLSRQNIERLRPFRHLAWATDAAAEPAHEATLLYQLAAAGIPIVGSCQSTRTRELLGVELAQALDATRMEHMEDPIFREAASIRMRRSALRIHGTGPRLRQLGALASQPVNDEPTVSIVLMTRRPHRLEAALAQIRRQTYPRLELVLGLHGEGFDDAAVVRLLRDLPMASTVVPVPAERTFGDALNAATARCDGRLLTKWDDDDLYGSEHIWDLVLAADYSGATVVGKAAEFTLVSDAATTVRRNSRYSERFARHVAGGTILLRRETLQALGGWRPQPRSVDDALLRQVRDYGGTVFRTHGFGYMLVRHDEGHTWNVGPEYFLTGDHRRWPTASPLQNVALEQRLGNAPSQAAH